MVNSNCDMDALIDTNVLYRLAQVLPEGDFSRRKIEFALSSFDRILVSEISIYELFTHFAPNFRGIRKCLKYISKSTKVELRAHPVEGFDPMDVVSALVERKKPAKRLLHIYGRVYAKKLFIELELCRFLIESALSVFALCLNDSSINPIAGNILDRYLHSVMANIATLRQQFTPIFRRTLLEFYSQNRKSSWFKAQMESIMMPSIFGIATAYVLALIGTDISQYQQLTVQEKQNVDRLIQQNALLDAVLARMNGQQNVSILDSVATPHLENAISQYETQMNLSIPPGNVGYFSELIRRILTAGRKIEKNDLLDSEFLRHYGEPDVQIISLDGPFRRIVATFDAQYAGSMEAFEKSVRK